MSVVDGRGSPWQIRWRHPRNRWRKLRFAAAGTGKRGGGRVVYYYLDDATPVYALLAYAKSARTDLAPAERRTVARLAAAIRTETRRSEP